MQSSFVSSKTATALLSSGAIPYCLQVLQKLLPFWRQYTGTEVTADLRQQSVSVIHLSLVTYISKGHDENLRKLAEWK